MTRDAEVTASGAAQAGSNRRSWQYFDERLSELRKHDVENIIARGQLLIEAHDELERGSYEDTVKRHMDLSEARRYRIVAAHPIISNRGHGHALPPSMRTLYELTMLSAAVLREKLADRSINPRLERKEVALWRRAERRKGEVTVDGETIEREPSSAEKLKAARAEIENLKAQLARKENGGSLFDLKLDSAEVIGKTLADNMSEQRFDIAVKAAKARYKAKRQKPAG